MKNKLAIAVGVLALGAFTMFSLNAKKVDNNVSLSAVSNTATAAGEDPITACNSWCINGSVCVLRTSAGFDINCYGWAQP